jgi:hypothetical protein
VGEIEAGVGGVVDRKTDGNNATVDICWLDVGDNADSKFPSGIFKSGVGDVTSDPGRNFRLGKKCTGAVGGIVFDGGCTVAKGMELAVVVVGYTLVVGDAVGLGGGKVGTVTITWGNSDTTNNRGIGREVGTRAEGRKEIATAPAWTQVTAVPMGIFTITRRRGSGRRGAGGSGGGRSGSAANPGRGVGVGAVAGNNLIKRTNGRIFTGVGGITRRNRGGGDTSDNTSA